MIWLIATVALYLGSDFLYRRSGRRAFAHPVLLPVLLLGAGYFTGLVDMQAYQSGVAPLYVLLAVAVVALAVPLYRSIGLIRHNRPAVFAAVAGGSIAGVSSALLCAVLLAAPGDVQASLMTKSITTPLAVTATEAIEGLAPLSAAVVILTGLFAALVGPAVLRGAGIDDDLAVGLALGTAGHAIGTAEAVRLSDTMGAAAAFAMTVNGVATALLLPLVWPFLRPILWALAG